MILSDLRAAVVRNLGNRTDKTLSINTAFNLALTEIMKRHPFRAATDSATQWETFGPVDLAAGNYITSVPGNILQIQELRLLLTTSLRGKRLAIKLPGWCKQRFADPPNIPMAEPWVAYYELGNIYTLPRANQDYQLTGTLVMKPTGYASDSTENPLWGTDMSQILWVTAYMMGELGRLQEAPVWTQAFNTQIALDITNDLKKPGEDLNMDEYNPHDQRDGYPNMAAQPWLDPFISADSQRRGDY